MNMPYVFNRLLCLLNVETVKELAVITNNVDGNLCRMRSGTRKMSPKFFLSICIMLKCTPQELSEKIGLPLSYFDNNEKK